MIKKKKNSIEELAVPLHNKTKKLLQKTGEVKPAKMLKKKKDPVTGEKNEEGKH